MARGELEKNGLIERQKNPSPTGNRYHIRWEEPAPKPIPARTRKGKLVVIPPNLFGSAKAASGTKRRRRAGSQGMKKQPKKALPDLGKQVKLID
jgi:hypothetical protein